MKGIACSVELLLAMKYGYLISSRNQSNSLWNGNPHPLPSRSKPNKRRQSAILWQQCSGTSNVFSGGLYATRKNDQLRCRLRNSREAPRSIAKQTARHAVKRCLAPPR
ncbi:hypothetical protein TNCV_1911141 [Trichonephila clavipes]|nr:hypothetical protein TNCV_1911141 [Trichonephila clavipes]